VQGEYKTRSSRETGTEVSFGVTSGFNNTGG
jgi:hypothetical protein